MFYKNLIIAVYLVVIVLPGMLACGGKKENPSKERIAKEAEEPEKAEKPEKPMPPLEKAIPGEELEPELFELKTEYEAYSPETTQIYCILTSHEERQIYYGCQTGMEVLLDGEWYTLPYGENAFFNCVLHGANIEGEWVYEEVSLLRFDYEFPEGTYRVVFPCCLDEYEPSQGKTFDRVLYAEFQIQKDAERLVFDDIRTQSLEPEQAIAEGCVVLKGGSYQGEEQVETFLWKAMIRIPCQMRLVDCDKGIVRELAYQPLYSGLSNAFLLTIREGEKIESRSYAFLGSRRTEGRTEIILSSYPCLEDVWEMGMGFFYPWDSEPILVQKEGEEPEWYKEWIETLEQIAVRRMEHVLPRMIVSNQAGTRWMELSFWEESDETMSRMKLDLYEADGMHVKGGDESYRTWQRDYPVYVFPVGEEDFGVLFQLTNGSYGARRYSGETGRVTKRLYGKREELVEELRESGN